MRGLLHCPSRSRTLLSAAFEPSVESDRGERGGHTAA